MSNIQIRAWHPYKKQMVHQFSGYLISIDYGELEIGLTNDKGDYEEMEIMLRSGVQDSNNKPIYAGDIICHPQFYDTPEMAPNPDTYGEVKYENGFFTIYGEPLTEEVVENNQHFYVAGNIYQNQELLKK